MAFFARQLQGAESRYSATELEALAVIASIEHFSHYLYDRQFMVYTDHKGLCALSSSKFLNRRLQRLALKLQQWACEIQYRPGSANGNADGLSRQERQDPEEDSIGLSADRAGSTAEVRTDLEVDTACAALGVSRAGGDVEAPPHLKNHSGSYPKE